MSERRYKIGLKPAYDKRYERKKIQNPVLSPKNFAINWTMLSLGDKDGIEALRYEHLGDEDGNIKTQEGLKYALLTQAKLNLASKQEEVEQFQQRRANEGKEPLEVLPEDIQAGIYECEADLDLELEVVAKLTDLLAKANAQIQKLITDGMLKYGPNGVGKICPTPDCPSGRLVMTEGQKVGRNAEGQLFIDEIGSPYNGMLMTDYRKHVVLSFLEKRQDRNATLPWSELPPWPECVPRPETPKVESLKAEKKS